MLIPKVDNPPFFIEFGPKILYNVTYKLYLRVLVNRLRPMFNDMVSLVQSRFILEKEIINNVIIFQELIYDMHKSKKKSEDVIYKLD